MIEKRKRREKLKNESTEIASNLNAEVKMVTRRSRSEDAI
jgi:hypothetical protein